MGKVTKYVIGHFAKKEDWSKMISFIRGFKKGKCAIIYIAAVPLYCIGHMYAGQGFISAFFSAINKAVILVVLRYETSSISALMQANALYCFTVYFCFALVGLNALFFTFSLISQHLWTRTNARKAKATSGDKLYIFGNNPGSISIYRSEKNRSKVIIDSISDKDCDYLYMKGISYISTDSFSKYFNKIFSIAEAREKKRARIIMRSKLSADERKYLYTNGNLDTASKLPYGLCSLVEKAKRYDNEYVIIVNTGDDDRNISICTKLISCIESSRENIIKDEADINLSNKAKDSQGNTTDNSQKNSDDNFKREARFLSKIKIFVFGDPRYETLYEKIVSGGYGCIRYINKYREIAIDFVEKYPFSKFLDETQVDYETSLIKENVDINVALIGFGRTNRQLFLTSVANNQFLTAGKEGPRLKQVKYFIFDKEKAENNKNLNHGYYRYKNEFLPAHPDGKGYLPLPDLPAEDIPEKMDINDSTFYNNVRNIVTRNSKSANFIVIAFGTDLENLDMAQKLIEKRKEWRVENLAIFVKVRTEHNEQKLLSIGTSDNIPECYFIGNEKEVVYDIEKIVGENLTRMALMRNETYNIESAIKNNTSVVVDDRFRQANRNKAYSKWYEDLTQIERESNLYCCLSIRSKLNLMGLDCCKKDASDEEGLTRDEYMKIYAGEDQPDISKYNVTVDGTPIVHYTLNFPDSRRKTMAIHEHQRWNSFMLSKGMIPSTEEQIKNEKNLNEKPTDGKDYKVCRRHGNLTTFDGLIQFRQIVAKREGNTEEGADVIKYDYQLMDDAHWFLDTTGYKIIKHVKMK